MRHALYLTLGAALLISAPAFAQTFYPGQKPLDSTAYYAGPPVMMRSGSEIVPPTPAQQREALAAHQAAPKSPVAANVVPNGPLTANPPGAGASSADTLREHGATGTNAMAQNQP